MPYPADRKYTKEHEWIQVNGNSATIGITHYAQESLGEKARRIRAAKENSAATTASGESARKPASPAAADLSATLGLISETDPEKYAGGVRLLLEQERFRALDDLAAGDRANRTRFAGGEWKLRAFYDAIASPAGST